MNLESWSPRDWVISATEFGLGRALEHEVSAEVELERIQREEDRHRQKTEGVVTIQERKCIIF